MHERNLGRIGDAAEHRLAEEHAADGHPVQSAGKRRAVPAFDRVRVSGAVQPAVRGDHRLVDPGAVLSRAGRRTFADHTVERGICGGGERLAPQRAVQGPADVQGMRPEHRARVGGPPQDRLAPGEPREDAVAIRIQQAPRAEVAAGREQAVRFVERERRIGEVVRGRARRDSEEPQPPCPQAPRAPGSVAAGPVAPGSTSLAPESPGSRGAAPADVR